jgi:DNA-binding response OmpR family regulator
VARILIAEDDPLVASFVEKGLRANGFSTFLARDGGQAQHLALTDEFDLLILDMGLPEHEGFHVLQELRARGKKLPVLVLTGRSERDVVMCLKAGADDYMTKPFHFEELIARVRTRLRTIGTEEVDVLSAGDLRLDLKTRRATLHERTVELTSREFALLELLIRHAGQVLSREQVLSQVWGHAIEPGTNVVNVYVNALRRKLGPEVIETIRGAGYRLRPVLQLEAEAASAAVPTAGYLVFYWRPSGYGLEERQGKLPEIGQKIALDGASWRLTVSKIGNSPLPGDERLCVFLEG